MTWDMGLSATALRSFCIILALAGMNGTHTQPQVFEAGRPAQPSRAWQLGPQFCLLPCELLSLLGCHTLSTNTDLGWSACDARFGG